MQCTCCGLWQIRPVTLEHGQKRLRVTHRGYHQGDLANVEQVRELLHHYGGPDLSLFAYPAQSALASGRPAR